MRFSPLIHVLAGFINQTLELEWSGRFSLVVRINDVVPDEVDDGLYSACLVRILSVRSLGNRCPFEVGAWIEVSALEDPPSRVLSDKGRPLWSDSGH